MRQFHGADDCTIFMHPGGAEGRRAGFLVDRLQAMAANGHEAGNPFRATQSQTMSEEVR